MRGLPLLNPELAASLQRQWGQDQGTIATAFFKCTRWQREDTMDAINCPFHYFCDSVYPGHYPAAVDLSVLLVAVVSYLSSMALAAAGMATRSAPAGAGRAQLLLRKYLLPGGPVVLPLLLLALANGHRTGAVIPLSSLGPAVFLLVLVSVLAFENYPAAADGSLLKYALLESSTVSGVLHASLYLESVVMPYYTGLDAMVASELSGECPTCVCRREALVVGGSVVSYRAWSPATFAVVATLCSRLAYVRALRGGEAELGGEDDDGRVGVGARREGLRLPGCGLSSTG